MEDNSDQPAQKKRRVTKACDRCRQKRQRCETGPSPDGACAICITAGTPELCTFTRQSKRRGPQRGVAQSLAEKINALERLMGHLLIADRETILSLSESFFHPTTLPLGTATSYLQAFRSTSLPQLLEELAPSVESVPIEVIPSDDRMSIGEPSWKADSPIASTSQHSPSISLNNRPSPQNQPRLPSFSSFSPLPPQNSQLPLPHPHSHSVPASQSYQNSQSPYQENTNNGLQTLASAAFADYSTPDGMEALDESNKGSPKSFTGSFPPLPTEMIRHQLVDLYFSQIVHPTYPMLDKSRFFRWSAQLPNQQHLIGSYTLPPELYFAVFAISIPYLNPIAARSVSSADVYASASRAALFESISKPSLESVQAACILALYDWGIGAMDRAWIMSCLAIAMSIRLSLHLKSTHVDQSLAIETDPESYKVKTFYSSVIIHTLLSLRLKRAPMVSLEDYTVPLPPSDGPENYELCRRDPSEELRALYDPSTHSSPRQMYPPRIHAVRSCALSAFSQTAKLSIIAIGIIRYELIIVSNDESSNSREVRRQDLANRLASWERELPGELRMSEEVRGTDGMTARSRHVVELQLLLCSLYQILAPPPNLLNIAFNPEPEATHYQMMILSQFLSLFTVYRCLPTIELSLYSLAVILSKSNASTTQNDIVFRAFLELGNIFPNATTSYSVLQSKSRLKLPLPLTPLPMQSMLSRQQDDPLRNYLDYPNDPTQSVAGYLDFSQYDQSDLLIPLGLVNSDLTWSMPEESLDRKPSTLMDESLYSGISPMGMRTPLAMNSPTAMTPTASSNNFNGIGGAYSTDLFERWLDKGHLDFGYQQQG